MSNVLEVAESKWVKDGKDMTTWYVTLDDRTENVPCYDERAKSFVSGAPLPEGFEITKSKAGKDYIKAPGQAGGGRGGGGYAQAWRNSEAGERFNQERMNRRTALMQAVEAIENVIDTAETLAVADSFYAWLTRDSAGAPPVAQPKADSPSVGPWGEKVTAQDPPPTASPSITSGGMDGTAAKAVGPATGEGADNPTALAKLSEAYGSGPRALKAARAYYTDAPPASLSALSGEQIRELIEVLA